MHPASFHALMICCVLRDRLCLCHDRVHFGAAVLLAAPQVAHHHWNRPNWTITTHTPAYAEALSTHIFCLSPTGTARLQLKLQMRGPAFKPCSPFYCTPAALHPVLSQPVPCPS